MTNEKPTLLLEPEDIKPSSENMRVRGAFNPAVTRLPNGKVLLLVRIAETPIHGKRYFLVPIMKGTEKDPKMHIDKLPRQEGVIGHEGYLNKWGMWRLPTISHLRKVLLDETGTKIEQISQSPDFYGIKGEGDFGVEDARITFFKKQKLYAMTYVSVSKDSGVSTTLATSKDLTKWNRKGIIFRQQNKDAVLFPEKINGYYVALHRPEGLMDFDKPNIWISYSKDLIYWGRDKPLLAPRRKGWDALRIGPGTVPIRIKEGFLEIYHGVCHSRANDPESDKIYRAGALLFSAKDPSKILARTPASKALFGPEGKYEKTGFMKNVVFPTGKILSKNKKNLLVYSGGGDSNTTVRELSIKKVLNSMEFK